MSDGVIVVRGGGDLGSGVALRLWRIGFTVVILETDAPLAVRRTVAFCEAVHDGLARVEEATARLCHAVSEALAAEGIAVLIDPAAAAVPELHPVAVVDAIMAKRNTGTYLDMAPTVIGLGPGFRVGIDAHAVVETNRGPDLGRVLWEGSAEPDTGEPGYVKGATSSRVLRSPAEGAFVGRKAIADIVGAGEVVGEVQGETVRAGVGGVVRGLIRDGTKVTPGMKVGDIDPRSDPTLCYRVSDKALAVGGGVVEAILLRSRGTLRRR